MKLRHLEYFVAAAEELNFTHAADRLHVSQPPFSKQIQDLEGELGVNLFQRERKGVALTGGWKSIFDTTGHWIEGLEDRARRFPRESLQISFLLGALLQILGGRGLLPKLVGLMLWLARPILVGFAAWRLYQLVAGRSSSGKTSTFAR